MSRNDWNQYNGRFDDRGEDVDPKITGRRRKADFFQRQNYRNTRNQYNPHKKRKLNENASKHHGFGRPSRRGFHDIPNWRDISHNNEPQKKKKKNLSQFYYINGDKEINLGRIDIPSMTREDVWGRYLRVYFSKHSLYAIIDYATGYYKIFEKMPDREFWERQIFPSAGDNYYDENNFLLYRSWRKRIFKRILKQLEFRNITELQNFVQRRERLDLESRLQKSNRMNRRLQVELEEKRENENQVQKKLFASEKEVEEQKKKRGEDKMAHERRVGLMKRAANKVIGIYQKKSEKEKQEIRSFYGTQIKGLQQEIEEYHLKSQDFESRLGEKDEAIRERDKNIVHYRSFVSKLRNQAQNLANMKKKKEENGARRKRVKGEMKRLEKQARTSGVKKNKNRNRWV